MTSAPQNEGPAWIALQPSRGSQSRKGNLNMDSNITAASERQLDYRDLESELHDAVNMSEIACDMIEHAQGHSNHSNGYLHLSDEEVNLISFAVYHANQMVRDLKKKWNAIHDANVVTKSAQKGASA